MFWRSTRTQQSWLINNESKPLANRILNFSLYSRGHCTHSHLSWLTLLLALSFMSPHWDNKVKTPLTLWWFYYVAAVPGFTSTESSRRRVKWPSVGVQWQPVCISVSVHNAYLISFYNSILVGAWGVTAEAWRSASDLWHCWKSLCLCFLSLLSHSERRQKDCLKWYIIRTQYTAW